MNTGVPAFPVHPKEHELSDIECAALSGMSLRDYFAAKAMQGLISSRTQDRSMHFHPEDDVAYCYRIADAMLAARDKA